MAKQEKKVKDVDVIPAPIAGEAEIKISVETVKETVKPISIRKLEIPEPVQPTTTDGKYYLVEVDADGNEVGDVFSIGKRTFDKVFRDNPKFIVKKNPK